MAVLLAVLAVSVASLAVLAILVAGLFKELKLLAASLEQFKREITPHLERIRASSEAARERADELAERRADASRGARIRR